MKGRLYIVGIGPGSREQMTAGALEALEQSEIIVGYPVYNDLVKPLFPNKRYLQTPMRKEEERCQLALDQAREGRTVSLICSGDAGVYGLAGLALEMNAGESEAEVRVLPGVTAALSGAALLGAPLISDFAVISLSDHLTPWEVIERRLRKAAAADFSIVLYNPASRLRKDSLRHAVSVLREMLPADRICGVAERIGREGECARLTTLGELSGADMFSTIFIGSSSTYEIGGKMVTQRGYRCERNSSY